MPGHKLVVVAGDEVMVGVAGDAFTVIIVDNEVPLHPNESVTVTLKVPLIESTNGLVAAPLLHAYFTNPAVAVRVSFVPWQMVATPFPRLMVGTGAVRGWNPMALPESTTAPEVTYRR